SRRIASYLICQHDRSCSGGAREGGCVNAFKTAVISVATGGRTDIEAADTGQSAQTAIFASSVSRSPQRPERRP
ncbi:hypothetical protein OAE77_00965, partial [bacterium]|nr:hypothetical protein [bacterium]